MIVDKDNHINGGTVGLITFKTKALFDDILVTTDPIDDESPYVEVGDDDDGE